MLARRTSKAPMPTRPIFLDYVSNTLLPLCRDRFTDTAFGGFHEHLDASGAPLPLGTKRVMVQARQLYVLCHAALLGDPSGRAAAEVGYDFLRRAYHDGAQGGWFFRANAAGEPTDRSKDLYAHAFVLFALAYLHRAFAMHDAIRLAGETWDVIVSRLAAPGGGFWEGGSEHWEPSPAMRRQNPHMHLLEALLALYEATGETRWLTEAHGLIDLFQTRLFHAETGTVGEFFTADWTPHADHGHLVEPGHHFEWVWLLHRYASLAGRPVDPAADALFTMAARHGFDPADGGLHDQLDRSGRPVLRSRRIWPVTEAIKAHVVRAEAGLSSDVAGLTGHLVSRFLHPAELGWVETMAADGVHAQLTLPGSTPYHLFAAAAEIRRVQGQGNIIRG